jgi:hypothetical protein
VDRITASAGAGTMGQNDFAARKSWASRVVVGFWWYTVAPLATWRTRARRRWRRAI